MGIFDEAYGTDDPFNTGRTNESGKSPGDYGRMLADTLAGAAGGDGGGLPGSAPGIAKMSLAIGRNTDGRQQLDPVSETGVSAIKPLPSVQVPAPAAVVRPAVTAPEDSVFGKATRFLNRIAQPEREAGSDTGTLGLRIQREASVDPQTATGMMNRMADTERAAGSAHAAVGMRAAPEARFNPDEAADILNRMAYDDREASVEAGAPAIRVLQEAKAAPGQPGKVADRVEPHDYPPRERAAGVAEPADMLAQLQSARRQQSMGNMISRLLNRTSDAGYAMTGDRAHGMAAWGNARFDPGVINGYSAYDRRLAEDTVSTALNRKDEVSYDPALARMQVLPFLDRFNSPHDYDTHSAHTGFSGARFSMQDLNEQVRDHMLNGSNLSLAQVEQTARTMASLDNTPYGRTVRNFMASVDNGMLTLGQEAVQTTAMVLSALPPTEMGMFHYQQQYIAHGNDTAGFAQEVENMGTASNRMANRVYGRMAEGKQMLAGIRTADYNDLRYFTADPARMALLRPDRLTGDFFEKFLPGMVSLYLPTRGAVLAELSQGTRLLTQFGWIAKRAYNTAATEKLIELQRHPSLVDNDPAFRRYMRNSLIAHSNPEKARECYMEGAARKSGLQGALVGVITYAGSHALRSSTSTGTEGPVLQYLQRFVLHEAKNMGDEVINSVNGEMFENAGRRGGKRGY